MDLKSNVLAATFPAGIPTDFLGKKAETTANGDHMIVGHLATMNMNRLLRALNVVMSRGRQAAFDNGLEVFYRL